MENIRNNYGLVDIGESARRQYINATSLFTAFEEARKKAAQFRGGMYWKTHSGSKIDYLIRTQTDNSQHSLGPRSNETEMIYQKFIQSKQEIEARLDDLLEEMEKQRRMNRALMIGRAPQMLVSILNMFSRAGIADHFRVVGTHALYAYEAASGVRIEKEGVLETNDVDLLWLIDRKLKFQTQMEYNASSMISLLKKVDNTFEIRDEQRHTAVNSKGFEVDIIRRITPDNDMEDMKGSNPSRMTMDDDDLIAIKARSAGTLQGAEPFSSIIVSPLGYMARINTVSPLSFVKVKTWLANLPDRDPMKRSRDKLQAAIIEKLAYEYLPHLSLEQPMSTGRSR